MAALVVFEVLTNETHNFHLPPFFTLEMIERFLHVWWCFAWTNSSLWALLSMVLDLSWFTSPSPFHQFLSWLSLWDPRYFKLMGLDFQDIHTEALCDWDNLIAIHVPMCLAQSRNQDGSSPPPFCFFIFAGHFGAFFWSFLLISWFPKGPWNIFSAPLWGWRAGLM